ncbi:MAG: DUF5103 domain-containing protein [Bacteroidetes bacterium]|nr:DUF5103 domain-containing protein [Bacteroidota bacterium]
MNKFSIILIITSIALMGCPGTTMETTESPSYSAQKELIPNDHTYEASIQSVQLYQAGVEESYPVLFLNTTSPLTLEFDELIPENQRESDFTVEFVNCDADWNPTNVLPIEFFEGFAQQRIENFERSSFTKVPYVHYRYQFPRENEFFKISGNYLLIAYRNNNRNDLILSRRFIVVERKLGITPKYLLNDRVERIRMSEFSFDLSIGGMNIYNPANDLYIKVLQNFRWDNYMVLREPRFARDKQFEYYIDLAKGFRGGNEYRRLDIRSTRFYAEGIQDVEEKEDIYEIFLYKDDIRRQNIYLPRRDRNGSYRIGVQEWPNADLNADYVSTNFFLDSPEPIPDGEVYVFGRFSDWQLRSKNKMTYNDDLRRYEGTVILKQGVYDYAYGVEKNGDFLVDESVFEGPHFESENFYTILVYYRAPGDRTDRLVGYQPVNYYE